MSTHTIATGEFQRMILAVDGYGRAAALAPVVKALAPAARRTLVHVYPVTGPSVTPAADTPLREEALAMLASERINAGVPDAAIVAVGDANVARGLQRAAAETGADLLVIGPSGESPLGRMVLGEAGRAIFQGAPCPVLVAPLRARVAPDRPRTIGVAFDGSPEAAHALTLAGALAADLGAQLEVVQAVEVGTEWPFAGSRTGEYSREVMRRERERLLHVRSALVATPCHEDVVEGPTREVLRALAQRVDVLCCGSRGWGPAARVAFGSTADDLIHDAPCPVIVVPRGAQLRHMATPGETDVPTTEADDHA